MVQALLIFAASSVVVIYCGVFLAKYGDAIASLMGWGRLWMGTILVAIATSLPEVATITTTVIRDQPELASGTVYGASMANMKTLAWVVLIFGGARFFRQAALEQRYLALVAIALTGLALTVGYFPLGLSVFEVGLASLLVLALYLVGMRLVYVTRPDDSADQNASPSAGVPSLQKAWVYFLAASAGILVAAPILAFSVEEIAETTGLATSFLGVVVLALVTTMPELSTSIAAVRMGATDLALGNLYGSCAFNILILAIADPFYRGGILVETLETDNLAAGLFAMGLMVLGLFQLLLRGSSRYAPVMPTMGVMTIVYLGGLYLVYALG